MSGEQTKQSNDAIKLMMDTYYKRAEQLGMTFPEYQDWSRQLDPIGRHRESVALFGASDDPEDDFKIYDRATDKTYFDYEVLEPTIVNRIFIWLHKRLVKPWFD